MERRPFRAHPAPTPPRTRDGDPGLERPGNGGPGLM